MSEFIDLTRVLCRLGDLDATGCREFRLGSGDWPMRGFVVRSSVGVHAYVNRCAHQSLQLNYDKDRFLSHDNAVIVCFVHGALFTKDTGFCIAGPCSGLSLAKIPIKLVGDCVLLADEADPEELAARHA
jgi:nitrite reductase/ring-hydroxylating ferredoxin subunit